jgi:hypothetical protein
VILFVSCRIERSSPQQAKWGTAAAIVHQGPRGQFGTSLRARATNRGTSVFIDAGEHRNPAAPVSFEA